MCDFECGFIRNVKYGFSTGICAAAASKASAIFQASGKIPDFVTVKNLENHEFNIRVFSEKGNFYVIKDSGDDRSDVTNGIKIFSHVEILADNDRKIFFSSGEGVGIVTLPGLKILCVKLSPKNLCVLRSQFLTVKKSLSKLLIQDSALKTVFQF